jgi:hypothetical protein
LIKLFVTGIALAEFVSMAGGVVGGIIYGCRFRAAPCFPAHSSIPRLNFSDQPTTDSASAENIRAVGAAYTAHFFTSA